MVDMISSQSRQRIQSLLGRCLGDEAVSAAREIERDGLWEYVVNLACEHEVGGAMIGRLRAERIEPPQGAWVQLEACHEQIAAANAYRQSRIAPCLRRLAEEGIAFRLLKGVAMNAVFSDHAGSRAMIDVDVLIRPEDADRADRVLRELGCTPGADLLNDDFYPRFYYEREYLTSDRPAVKIDLHVRPFRPLRYARTVPRDAMWAESLRVRYGEAEVAIPGLVDMLIHLAGHAACHGCSGLKWLYDIRLWLDRFGDQIDMDDLAWKCRAWGITAAVRQALEAVAMTFGSASGSLNHALETLDGSTDWREKLMLAQAPKDIDRPLAALVVNMLCTPGWRFRLGYLRSVLVPGRKHLGQLYPRRHFGWPIMAHLVRAGRSIARPFRSAEPQAA